MPDDILKAYYRATRWFRDMEFSDPYHKEWGEYADAMDAVLSTAVSVVRCKDCKWHGYYCTEATDGTALYTCHHPCANDVPRPADWFCADGKRKGQQNTAEVVRRNRKGKRNGRTERHNE